MTQVKVACGTISLEAFVEARQCVSLLNSPSNMCNAQNEKDESKQEDQNASSFVSVSLNPKCFDCIQHSDPLKAFLLKELECFPFKIWKNPVFCTSFTSLHNYIKIMQIGQGAYGDVWLAEDIEKNRLVALKKLRFGEEREGFSKTGIREISLLRSLQHPNIVAFYGVCTSRFIGCESKTSTKMKENFVCNFDNLYQLSKGSVWMVFEYLPFDLNGTIEKNKEKETHFTIPEVKRILYDILSALQFCHSRNIIHRDLKSANLLLSSEGRVKLADFGLARYFDARTVPLTNRVITFWYRPPELLLGADWYTPSVDIWSTGCIFAELILNKSLFGADREASVLKIIGDTLGKPSDIEWPEKKYLPLWNVPEANPFFNATVHQPSITYCSNPSKSLPSSNTLLIVAVPQHSVWSKLYEKIGSLGVDLLKAMLRYNPSSRISASDALKHPWLQKEELIQSIDLKRFSQTYCHAYALRKERERHKQKISHGSLDKPILKRTRMLSNVDFIRRSQRPMDSPALLTPSNQILTNKSDTALSNTLKNPSPQHKRQKTLPTKKNVLHHFPATPEKIPSSVSCNVPSYTGDSQTTKPVQPSHITTANATAPMECSTAQHEKSLPKCDTVKHFGDQIPITLVSFPGDNGATQDAHDSQGVVYEATMSQKMPCAPCYVTPVDLDTIKTSTVCCTVKYTTTLVPWRMSENSSAENLSIVSLNQPCRPCTPLIENDLEETMDIEPEEEKIHIKTPEPPSSLLKPKTPPPPPPRDILSTNTKRLGQDKKEATSFMFQGKEEMKNDSLEKVKNQEWNISPGQIVSDVGSSRQDTVLNGMSHSYSCRDYTTSRYYNAPNVSYPSCEPSRHGESTNHETLPYTLKEDPCIRKGYTYKKKILSSCTEASHHLMSNNVQKSYYKNRSTFEPFNGTTSGYYQDRKHHGIYETVKKNRYTPRVDYTSYFHDQHSYNPRSTSTKPPHFVSNHSPPCSSKESYWERRQSYEPFSYSYYVPSPNDHTYAQQRSPCAKAHFHPPLYHRKEEHDSYTTPHYDVQKKRLTYPVKKY